MHRSTFSPLQDANPTPSFGGFGLREQDGLPKGHAKRLREHVIKRKSTTGCRSAGMISSATWRLCAEDWVIAWKRHLLQGMRAWILFCAAKVRRSLPQCKSHKSPVGPAVVRELYGSMIAAKADKAVLACTGGFTSGVRNFAKGKPIELVSASGLVELAERNPPRVGLTVRPMPTIAGQRVSEEKEKQ